MLPNVRQRSVEWLCPLGCCSCHCHVASLLNSDSAPPIVFLCSHLQRLLLLSPPHGIAVERLSCTARFLCPTLGLHLDGSLSHAFLPSHWAQSRALSQGTEPFGVFSQSHSQLQLTLPHDSPGWCGSPITSPDSCWTLGEFPWGLWAISYHGTSGVAISGH